MARRVRHRGKKRLGRVVRRRSRKIRRRKHRRVSLKKGTRVILSSGRGATVTGDQGGASLVVEVDGNPWNVSVSRHAIKGVR